MYNAPLKEEFLESVGSLRAVYEPVFRYSEDIEHILGKDLYAFQHSEFCFLFENNHWVNYYSQLNNKQRIKKYLSWAAQRSLCAGTREIDRMKLSDLSGEATIYSSYVKDADDLNSLLTSAYGTLVLSSEINSATVFDRTIVILSYYGIGSEEALTVRKNDIDFENKCIHFEGYTTPEIDPQSLQTLQIAKNLQAFEIAWYRGTKISALQSGDTLIRYPIEPRAQRSPIISDKESFLSSVRDRLSRRSRAIPAEDVNAGRTLKLNHIYKSGFFSRYRAYCQSFPNHNPEGVFPMLYGKQSIRWDKRKINTFLELYQRWNNTYFSERG